MDQQPLNFTVFSDFTHVSAQLTAEEIVDRIRNGYYRETVDEVRRLFSTTGKEAADQKKKSLPAITFSACYCGGRTDAKLTAYTGCITLDIDNQPQEVLRVILPVIRQCPLTHICCISPKGNGVKIIVRTRREDGTLPEGDIKSVKEYHSRAYRKVASFYRKLCKVVIDSSGQDIGRLCFFTYDAEVYYNPQSTPIVVQPDDAMMKTASVAPKNTVSEKSTTTPKAKDPKAKKTKKKEKQEIKQPKGRPLMLTLLYLHNKKEKYLPGNRNSYLFKLASRFNLHGISAEETEKALLSWFSDFPEKEVSSVVKSAYAHTDEHNTQKLNETQLRILHIEQYIARHYETRYNEMRCNMEFRNRSIEDSPFIPLDDLTENTIWARLNEAGMSCNVKVVQNLLFSDFSYKFHPIRHYASCLPAWDGKDHIGMLADSVTTTDPDFWRLCLERYLVAMLAAATLDDVVNHTVLLICGAQSIGKTTFINRLLPPELSDYLSTGAINTGNKDDLARVAQSMLINLDEFEGMTGREMNLFKDLITRKVISIRLPYAHRSQNFPHVASFAGTCNFPEVLHDPTGNRRYLCFMVSEIRFTDIDHQQLYAQMKHLLDQPDYRYWFTIEENLKVEENNRQFVFHTPEEELMLTHIRIPGRMDRVLHLTVSEIAELIHERTGYVYTFNGKMLLGKSLTKYGFAYSMGHNGRRYSVCVIDIEQVRTSRMYAE